MTDFVPGGPRAARLMPSFRRLHPVAPGVLIATSRRDATNSVVVLGDRGEALLIDPAWTPDELDGLATDIGAAGIRLAATLSTHAHHDHLLWHPGFGRAPRYASATTAAAPRAPMVADLGPGFPPALFRAAPPIRALTAPSVPWPGPLVVPVVTDAHEQGHTSYWLARHRVLVAGDLLSDREVPLLAGDDVTGGAYRAGLDALEPFVRRARLLIPGHGRPTAQPAPRLRADRAYLDAVDRGERPDDPRLANPFNAAAWASDLGRRRHA